jgi:serine/threonine protein kinase
MGQEYPSFDQLTERSVLVEVVDQPSRTPRDVEVLRQELMRVVPIKHPNVCRVVDAVPTPWGLVMVTEMYGGENLRMHIHRTKAQNGYTADELRHIASGICKGLAAIHAQGLVHGDLTPGNVMVRNHSGIVGERDVVIKDCGFSAERARWASRSGVPDGTPRYMSPERRRGGNPSFPDDVRALAMTIWEMLTVRAPKIGAEPRATAMRPALKFGLPEGLSLDEMRQIFRALHEDPFMRPAAQDFRFASPDGELPEIPARPLFARPLLEGDGFRAELDEDGAFVGWAEAPWTGIALELQCKDGTPIEQPALLEAVTERIVSGMAVALRRIVPPVAGWIRPTCTLVSLVGLASDDAYPLLGNVLTSVQVSVPDGAALAAIIVTGAPGVPGLALNEQPAPRRSPSMTDTAPLPPIVPGTVIANRYEVRQVGGKYNMGQEFLGVDRLAQQSVLLEVVDQPSRTPSAVELLRQELMQVRPLEHPNVCRVLDALPTPWGLVMVTEHRLGQTLDTHIGKRKVRYGYTAAELRHIASGICKGLAAIHAQGLIHGDLQPVNVIVSDPGNGIVSELSVVIKDCGFSAERARTSASQSGVPDGTPNYMSPERRRGGGPSVPDDVRALAMTIWEMLTVRVPEIGAEPRATAMRPALKFGLPEGFSLDEMRQIFRALHEDPFMRPAAQDFRFASPDGELPEIPAGPLWEGDLFRAELDEDGAFVEWAETAWTGIALELQREDGTPIEQPALLEAITKRIVSGMAVALRRIVPPVTGWIRPTRTLVSLVGITSDEAYPLLKNVLTSVEASVPDGAALAAILVAPAPYIPGRALLD